jgi:2-oxo-4-hydroxy-4-carboxy-5-ureidoimidazoline decarboxylase
MTLDELNRLPAGEARPALERCCGARAWAAEMCERRPYESRAQLLATAERIWRSLAPSDWREAFTRHPRIGDVASLRRRFAATAAWAASEQSGATSASEATLAELAAGNRAYEEKFGYIFIVCATGKSADEMLRLLEERIPNDPEREIANAAEEQMKITRIRLEKLLDETP